MTKTILNEKDLIFLRTIVDGEIAKVKAYCQDVTTIDSVFSLYYYDLLDVKEKLNEMLK